MSEEKSTLTIDDINYEPGVEDYCGSIKDPGALKISLAKAVLQSTEADFILDNYADFHRTICATADEVSDHMGQLLYSAGSEDRLIDALNWAFDNFTPSSKKLMSISQGREVLGKVKSAVQDPSRFNAKKVKKIVDVIDVEEDKSLEKKIELAHKLIKFCRDFKSPNQGEIEAYLLELINTKSILQANSTLAQNETRKYTEKKIRLMIREALKQNMLLENRDVHPGSVYGQTVARSQTPGGGKEVIRRQDFLQSRRARPDNSLYDIDDFIPLGQNEYIVMDDGSLWQTAGSHEGRTARRSNIIDLGDINDNPEIRDELIRAGFKMPKSFETPEAEKEDSTINDIKRYVRRLLTRPIPLPHRGFLDFLRGRTSTWTEAGLSNKEYNKLKELVILSLTREGRYIANNLFKENQGGLLSYMTYRFMNDIDGKRSSAIFKGEEQAGRSSGVFRMSKADQLAKWLGGANPEGGVAQVDSLAEKVQNDEPLIVVINDIYDFDDYEDARKFVESNLRDWKKIVKDEAVERFKDQGPYAAIRYLAKYRQATGYNGYPVQLTIRIERDDILDLKDKLNIYLASNPGAFKDGASIGSNPLSDPTDPPDERIYRLPGDSKYEYKRASEGKWIARDTTKPDSEWSEPFSSKKLDKLV